MRALRISRGTEEEVGCLAAAVREWCADARLGGMAARGHGRVEVVMDAIPGADDYIARLAAKAERIRSVLEGLS